MSVTSLTLDPLIGLAALASATLAAVLVGWLAPPPRRLSNRVRPYVAPSIARDDRHRQTGAFGAVFGPIARDIANWVGGLLDRGDKPVTIVKLRQAGWFQGLPEVEMVTAYRIIQLKTLAVAVVSSLVAGQVVGGSIGIRSSLLGLGLVLGSTRTRGRLAKAIEDRRAMMRIEIYTVNQLLAMRVRAGGGVIQAVTATVQRGSGAVVDELREALRLHRAGWAGPDAFRRMAEITPEPFCSRTYRLLASAEERGADLGQALLALSEDVRETRRESVKRTATKRRAAMLMPTIAILAPVLILFVAAPLPYLITSWQ